MTKNKTFLSFLMLALFASNAAALGSEELLVKALNAKQTAASVDYNDSTLINLDYVGAEASALVYVSSGVFSIDAPSGTAYISTININATAYDTLGELCDYINTTADVVCTMTGGKRDDLSVLMYDTAALEASGSDIAAAGGYSVLVGTGAVVADDTTAYTNRIGITPATDKRVLLKYCRVGNDGTGDLRVYGKLAKYEGSTDGITRDDTTLVWLEVDANDTTETVPDFTIEDGWLLFAKNAHVVIASGNASTAQSSDSTTRLQCVWEEK